MQPIIVWILGILAFTALLVTLGGFQRPVVFAVAVVFVLALLLGFFYSRR